MITCWLTIRRVRVLWKILRFWNGVWSFAENTFHGFEQARQNIHMSIDTFHSTPLKLGSIFCDLFFAGIWRHFIFDSIVAIHHTALKSWLKPLQFWLDVALGPIYWNWTPFHTTLDCVHAGSWVLATPGSTKMHFSLLN